MPQNLIAAALAEPDRDAVLALTQQIRAKLPFLRGLAADERRGLAKMGGKSVAFVRQALRTAEQNPALVPANTVQALREDLALLDALLPVRDALTQLSELVDDTATATGSDAYAAALELYAVLQATGRAAGLDELKALMQARFRRAAPAPAAPASPAA
jgi:hypothetical protein